MTNATFQSELAALDKQIKAAPPKSDARRELRRARTQLILKHAQTSKA